MMSQWIQRYRIFRQHHGYLPRLGPRNGGFPSRKTDFSRNPMGDIFVRVVSTVEEMLEWSKSGVLGLWLKDSPGGGFN